MCVLLLLLYRSENVCLQKVETLSLSVTLMDEMDKSSSKLSSKSSDSSSFSDKSYVDSRRENKGKTFFWLSRRRTKHLRLRQLHRMKLELDATKDEVKRLQGIVDRLDPAQPAAGSIPDVSGPLSSATQSQSDSVQLEFSPSTVADVRESIPNHLSLPSSPLQSPFVICLWGTRKSKSAVDVRKDLTDAFKDCGDISLISVCVGKRDIRVSGNRRRVWYHDILGEKPILLLMMHMLHYYLTVGLLVTNCQIAAQSVCLPGLPLQLFLLVGKLPPNSKFSMTLPFMPHI